MAIAQNPMLTAVKWFQFKRLYRSHASGDFQTDYFGLHGPQATILTIIIYRIAILKLRRPEATFKQKYFLTHSS